MRFRLFLFALGVASSAGAQAAPKGAFVRIIAQDSSGAPVANAELTVTRGLKDVIARGTTDDRGYGRIPVTIKDSTDLSITMRKIGYKRGDRLFALGPGDTTVVTIVVPVALGNSLDAVKVTAKQQNNARFQSYDLYADEIESSNGYIATGWDVVKALRPVMLTSRGGCHTGARDVWVNGERMRLPLPPTRAQWLSLASNTPLTAKYSWVPAVILSQISPEHIEEIHYHDCFDTSVAAVGHTDAIYVTLKPGVAYVQDVGSFVVTQAEEDRLAAKKK